MTQDTNTSRRAFLAAAGATAGLALAPGVTLFAPARAHSDVVGHTKVRWGMLIDINQLEDGGAAAVAACAKENGWQAQPGSSAPGNITDAQWIRTVKVTNPATKTVKTLPMMCQHCAEPPCVDVCPTGASMKRDNGIVLVDKHICIGCRYCILACPYGARSFVHEPVTGQRDHAPRGKGTVEGCTMCVHRIDTDRQPACAEAEPSIIFGDLNDPDSEISKRVAAFPTSQIRTDFGTEPGVYYRGLG